MPYSPVRILSVRSNEPAGTEEIFERAFRNAAKLGFDGLLWQPAASIFSTEADVLPEPASQCEAAGLTLLAEVELDRFPIDHPLVDKHPDAFAVRRLPGNEAPLDPRMPLPAIGEARARLRSKDAAELLHGPMCDRLRAFVAQGVRGFRFGYAERLDPAFLKRLVADLRAEAPDLTFIAGPPGLSRPAARALEGAGLDYLVSSFGWWDFHMPWLIEEYEALRQVAPLISEIRPEQLREGDDPASTARLLAVAASMGSGMIVPAALLDGAETDAAVARALRLADDAARFGGEMRRLTGSGSPVLALLRADAADIRMAEDAMLLLVNTDSGVQPAPEPGTFLPSAGTGFRAFTRVEGKGEPFAPLAGNEVRLLTARRAKPVVKTTRSGARNAKAAAAKPRLVVEDVTPSVPGGDFAVKRVTGESVTVEATIFADGHEQLAAELQWRAGDDKSWTAVRMEELPNNRWRATFPLNRLGRYEFAIEAWLDRFGGFRRDFAKKLDAGVALPVDHAEGRALIDRGVARADDQTRAALAEICDWLAKAGEGKESAALMLSPEVAELMDRVDERPYQIRTAGQRVDAERLAARYSSWYELFPRSQTNDASRHGTFDDVIARLPAIRDMGFDTLYFPPIHPIGRANRKGPDNSLTAGPADPGSPYAIGDETGGHDAIHPELGSFDDFDRLVEAAHAHGLEIALDFAIQCSPDHPWLKKHPGWFAWRSDGSLKYAENPPKKYQDIVNVDFYADKAVPDLWLAWRDVVLLWIGHGVKVFRVDNPHTKPLPFWEWMLDEVRSAHPDVIFLAEAFTSPAMMYRLGKIGFSQSYTYFTWRNHKAEIADYITELTTTAPKEFFRPHFFVNTPDINPPFLQTSGRPGFRIRAVLAATLSGLFGIYSGFELCEAAPLPGREEYARSEKYEIRPRDWNAPGNIIADIVLLNRLRRAHPALQTHLNTRFYAAHNENILYYGKPAPDGSDIILVAISLDPFNPQEANFEVPLWEFGLPDHGSVIVEDLANSHRFHWHGKNQHIRLDPAEPYRLWRIAPGGPA